MKVRGGGSTDFSAEMCFLTRLDLEGTSKIFKTHPFFFMQEMK